MSPLLISLWIDRTYGGKAIPRLREATLQCQPTRAWNGLQEQGVAQQRG
jgi:hypothetical protein